MRIETVLVLVAVLALAAWVIRRHQVARADREAMYTYGHALEVLGEITHSNEGPEPRAAEQQAEDTEDAEDDVETVADTSELPPPPDMSHLPPPPASVEPIADGRAPGDTDEDPSVAESAAPDPSVPPPGLYRPHVELRPPPIKWATPRKRRDPGPAARRTLGAVATLALVLAGASLLWALMDDGSDEETATPSDAPTTTHGPTDEPEPTTTEPTLPSPILPQEVTGDTVAFGLDAPFELALAATAPCWVSLTDEAGNVLLEETLQDGEERSVEITQGASLRIGNAGALHVAADGALLEHGGAPGQAMTLTFG